MGHTEQDEQGLVKVRIGGRGLYTSYKYVFLHTARNIDRLTLQGMILEVNDRAEDPGPLDGMEHFDLVAMVASWRSTEVYQAYLAWCLTPMSPWYLLDDSLAQILGDQAWAPRRATLSQGWAL